MRTKRLLAILVTLVTVAGSVPAAVGTQTADDGVWLAGDWHVHTSSSHDACHPANATGFAEDLEDGCGDGPHTLSAPGSIRMREAEARGLDYVRITDHNTLAGPRDAQANYDGPVTLVPGYEHSLPGGHAGISSLGLLDRGLFPDPSDPDGINETIDAVHEELGGLFVANHPYDGGPSVWTTSTADWDRIDAYELWNIHWLWRDDVFGPVSGTSNNDQALDLWTELLNQGHELPIVGASDSHWLATSGVQGPGQPTTWVKAEANEPAAIIEAVHEGRTYIAWDSAAPRVSVQATSASGETAGLGDTVGPGETTLDAEVHVAEPSRLRFVSCQGLEHNVPMPTDVGRAEIEVVLPADCWIRVDVVTVDDAAGNAPDDLVYRAVTSPIYVDSG